MANYNTIYVECFAPIWDHYFIMDNLVYVPKILVGEERQKKIAGLKNIEFYNRVDINNQSIDFDYELNIEENKIFDHILRSNILFNMYYRNSMDVELDERLFFHLTLKYVKMWFLFIEKFDLKVLILHEMPHLPYTFIGYLIFQYLKLKIIFSATLPFGNRAYFVDKLENYMLFKEDTKNYLLNTSYREENFNFFTKLQSEYGLSKGQQLNNAINFIRAFLIYFRNFLFPQFSNRLRFNVIRKGRFIDQEDRIYYFFIMIRTIKKYFRKKYYKTMVREITEDNKIKIFFALHFEPELAVYPLAGENFNQFEILMDLSKKLGEKGTIYVKEHPWIFDYSKIKGVIRENKFYKVLNEQPNIKFLNYLTNSGEFIERMDVIATLTGTIGWEAFFKKIPVLYYGFPWYAGLPGTKKYFTQINLEDFIAQCKDEFELTDYEIIYNVMKNSVLEVSTKMYSLSEDDLKGKASVLKSAIEDFIPIAEKAT